MVISVLLVAVRHAAKAPAICLPHKGRELGVCVNLVSGQRGPFPRLKLAKACWTCPPPPRRLTTIIKAILGLTHIKV